VAEVAQQPPEPLRPAAVPVGDDEAAGADPGTTRRRGEALPGGQWVASGVPHREIREVGVDVEERSAGNVLREIELTPSLGVPELPPAVDELVPSRTDQPRAAL
jgi:hypothetical protein